MPCRIKTHILQNHFTEIRLPQFGCGLDNLDWKHVFMNFVNVFGNTENTVDIFLLKVHNPIRSANMLLAEKYSSEEEIQRHVEGMSKARNLALEGILQCPPTND